MKISASLAQKIVDDLRLVLNYKVNFMDTDGLIIASSDAARLNTFHGGAALVLKQKKPLYIRYDGQYEGARKGINMPIYFEHNVIGVIGVSGDAEVLKLTETVRAMTEILIKEAYLNVMSFQKREKHRLIIETLMLDGGALANDTLFGIDLLRKYHVAVGSNFTTAYDLGYLHALLEGVFGSYDTIFFTLSHGMIIVLAPVADLSLLLTQVIERAKEKHNLDLNFGVGLTVSTHVTFTHGFETAKQALEWVNTKGISKQISYFKDLDLGMVVTSLDRSVRQLFLNNVLQHLSEKELALFCRIINSFAKHNGSLAACSQELFIHKNTLQYQLNKIKQLTGYDPRNYQDFAVLYLALLTYDHWEART